MMKSLNIDAVELSKYIVSKCTEDGYPISNLQLQKILYYIQKHFVKQNKIAFLDDIEAWQFGPVVPNSYYYFCGFGAMPITNRYSPTIDWDEDSKQAVDKIIADKRVLDPWVMVEETHKPDGAWATIYKDGEGNHSTIPIDLIRQERD